MPLSVGGARGIAAANKIILYPSLYHSEQNRLFASPVGRTLPGMGDRSPDRASIRNKLVAGLTAQDFDRIRPHLERIPLPQRERLLSPTAPTEYVYFPESG